MAERTAQTFTGWLQALGAEGLTRLLSRRPDVLHPPPGDLRSLSARLTSRLSVARAVDHLDVPALRQLAEAARLTVERREVPADLVPSPALVETGLLWRGEPTAPWRIQPEVIRQVGSEETRTALAELAGLEAPEPRPAVLPAERTQRLQAGTMTATVGLIIALIDTLDVDPAARLRSGGVARRDAQRLARALGCTEVDLAFAAELAAAAELLGADEEHIRPARAADAFLLADPAGQWLSLLDAWWSSTRQSGIDPEAHLLAPDLDRSSLPSVRRRLLEVLTRLGREQAIDREDIAALLRWERPLWSARTRDLLPRAVDEAIALGLLATPLRGPGVAATALAEVWLSGDREAARQAAAALLPGLTEEVLLQADLTAIVPGIPDPRLRSLLGRIARPDGRGQGQQYRFTPQSLSAGLHRGLSAADIREQLEAWSPTPVPQPLEYAIADAERRFGRLRAGRARSYLRTADPAELEEILHRQPVGIGLERIAPTVAISQLPHAALVSALEEIGARAVLESEGTPVVSAQAPERADPLPAPGSTQAPPPISPAAVDQLIGRWLAAPEPAPADEDAGPELTIAALRDAQALQRPVIATVADSRGGTHELSLVPLAVQAGRVRARRTVDDAEITLVAHRIRAVRPA